MVQATAQAVTLVTAMPQSADATLGTSLSLPLPLSSDGRSQDNESTFQNAFQPAPPQNLADRIKSRTRKTVVFTPIAYATSMANPQHPTSSSPSKTVLGTLKRPVEDELGGRPTRRRKLLQVEEAIQSSTTSNTKIATTGATITTPATADGIRPINDTSAYLTFASQVIKALEIRRKPRATRFGDRQNNTILDLLQNATPANDKEMLFLSKPEAADMLRPGVFHNGPILTEGQQPMPLQHIEDFLGEYYDDDSKVFIQDPSVQFASGQNFVREVTVGSVKKRILQGKSKGRPWNCLELATHVEDGLRPAFLEGEDSRLLTKLKLEHATGENASRRSYPQGYKEVEKWALLAESGALTEPHQDSHGYSTYITVNQGNIGFGWLSYPSDEERKAWTKKRNVAADRFRYVVLKPGQTVFFPAGTIHFVFRLPSAGGHTLAFGGHVLRCSNIVHWVKTLLEEKASPEVTNEDLTSSAPGYLNRVEKFVKQAQKNGTPDKWGGAEAVEEFLRLKEVFMAS